MKTQKSIIASIFLVIFSLLQLADLHVLEHDDVDDKDGDCEICQLAFENHDKDGYITSDVITIPCVYNIPSNVVRSNYEQQFFNTSINYSFLNRPPPSA